MKNPQEMLKIVGELKNFKENHPKFAQFFVDMVQRGIPEGTIMEFSIQRPNEEPITSNLRVQQSDIELFETVKKMS